MKNRIAFGALVFAFTVAGACVGRAAMSPADLVLSVMALAVIGGVAAALSGGDIP